MAYRVQRSPISPQATLLPTSYVLPTLVFSVLRTRQDSSHLRSLTLGILPPEILYSSLFTRCFSHPLCLSLNTSEEPPMTTLPNRKSFTLQFFFFNHYTLFISFVKCIIYNYLVYLLFVSPTNMKTSREQVLCLIFPCISSTQQFLVL